MKERKTKKEERNQERRKERVKEKRKKKNNKKRNIGLHMNGNTISIINLDSKSR